jgi:hypothetical protein
VGHAGHSFEAVEAVLANPFPPGTDPARILLSAVPRVRTPDDDEVHHLSYWQVHLWESLLRFRRAFGSPACTERLRAGYPEIDAAALRLAERATSGFPLTPIDSVGCHSALKELKAAAAALEVTVAALAGRTPSATAQFEAPVAVVEHPPYAVVRSVRSVTPMVPVDGNAPAGTASQDLFVLSTPPTRS